jgi:hypothetical protein
MISLRPARVSLRTWVLALTAGLAAVFAVGLAYAATKTAPPLEQVEPMAIEARPIAAFDKSHPERVRFGKLVWRGGLVLTSPSPHFGGWSGLEIGPHGKALMAVSDAGTWMRGELVYDKGRPVGLRKASVGPLKALSGKVLTRKRHADAEGLTIIKGSPEDGSVLISFERNHRIGHFKIDGKGLKRPSSYVTLPRGIKMELSSNRGLEAVAILRGGRYKGSLVAIAERLKDGDGDHTGWLWIKGKPRAFHLTDADGYDITDAAGLPDGGLLVLERRFRWGEGVKMRLRLIKAGELGPGARIKGKTLLDTDMGYEIDNMEGLAVNTGPGGEIIVSLISDDNFNRGLQRTVLLQFTLDGADLAMTPAHD